MEKDYQQNITENLYQERMKLVGGLKEVLKEKKEQEWYMRNTLSSEYFGEIDGQNEYREVNGKYSLEKTIKNYVRRKKRFVKKEFHRKLKHSEVEEIIGQMINLYNQMRGERKEEWEKEREKWEESTEYKALKAGYDSAEYAEWYYWTYIHF